MIRDGIGCRCLHNFRRKSKPSPTSFPVRTQWILSRSSQSASIQHFRAPRMSSAGSVVPREGVARARPELQIPSDPIQARFQVINSIHSHRIHSQPRIRRFLGRVRRTQPCGNSVRKFTRQQLFCAPNCLPDSLQRVVSIYLYAARFDSSVVQAGERRPAKRTRVGFALEG